MCRPCTSPKEADVSLGSTTSFRPPRKRKPCGPACSSSARRQTCPQARAFTLQLRRAASLGTGSELCAARALTFTLPPVKWAREQGRQPSLPHFPLHPRRVGIGAGRGRKTLPKLGRAPSLSNFLLSKAERSTPAAQGPFPLPAGAHPPPSRELRPRLGGGAEGRRGGARRSGAVGVAVRAAAARTPRGRARAGSRRGHGSGERVSSRRRRLGPSALCRDWAGGEGLGGR